MNNNKYLIAIKDEKGSFSPNVSCTDSLDVSIREFKHYCETEGTDFNNFPEDFSLWCVGTYNYDLGYVEAVDPMDLQSHVLLCKASDFVKKEV